MARRIQLRRDTETNWFSTNPVLAQGEIGINLTNNKIKIGNGSTAWNSLAYFDDKVTDFSAVATDIVPDADNTRDLGAPDKQWRHVYTAGGSIYLDNIKLTNVNGKFVATKVINPGEENEAEDPEDSDATSNISGGGNPFDQDLNTYDSVTFDGVGATTINVSQINGTNPGDELVIQANNNNWTFGTDGNLTLPAGGDIVDSNGDSVLSGGNANTGDVTFDGVKIIGAGEASGDGSGYSTLELVPDNSLYNNHQYLVIDPTTPNHIHIRAGGTQDNSDAELFLGGEKNYLRVRDNSGSVRMQTQTLQETGFFTFNTTLGFVSATWQSDGNGGYQVFMIEVTPELYNAISNSNSDSFIQLYDGTNYYNVTSTGMTPAVGAVVFGVVQAPDGGGPINIVEINITNFTLRTNYAELNGPDFTVNVYDDVRLTGSDVVSIRNRSVNDPVTIVTDYDDSERTWSFGSNGDLSLPQDGGLVFDRNNTSIRVGMGFHIASGEGISLDAIDQTDPNNLVYKSWGFAPTGILTLPNGSSIESTAGNGIGLTTDRGTILFGNSPEIGGPSHFHIMKPESTTGVDLYFGDDHNFVLQRGTAYGDDPAYGVEIGANDRNEGGQKRWRFGTDGSLTLPSTAGFVDRLYSDNSGSRTKLEKIMASSPTEGSIAKLELDLDNGHIRLAIGNYTGGNTQWIDNTWAFGTDGTLTLPEGGTITEGVVTSNPTIQLTPASPDVASQKLVIKGGGLYDYTQNGININYYNNTALVGDTLTFYVYSTTYTGQTLYWWIYPQGANISDPGSGTVVLAGSGGNFSFVLDSDDNEFTVRVSPEADNYDPANLGVETGLINSDAPTFDSPHHLHLTTGDLTETSIFLGTDDHNVRTTVDGSIEITTPTPSGSNNVWQFGTDGTTSFPSNKIKISADNSLVIETESLPPEPPTTIVISGADFSPVNTTYNKDGANSIWYPALYNPATDPYIEFTGGQYGIFVPGFGQALYVNTGTLNVPLTQWNTNPPLGSVAPTGVYTYPDTYVHNWQFGADGYLQFPNLSRLSAPQGSSTATFQAMNEFAIQTAKFGPTWTFGTDGTLTFPGGATVRDLSGEGPDDSVLILGAGATIAENQRAARIGINGSVEGVSIGAGTYDWSFTNDGRLTLPNDGIISAGGSGGLTLGGNYDVKIVSDYTDNNRTWTFNGSDGSVTFPDTTVQSTAWSGGRVVTAPTASTGAEGDKQGDLAFTSSHLYYCIADYNGPVGHQVTGVDYLGRASLNTNGFQLTKTAGTLQITVGDIISDSDGGATSTVVTVSSDDNYTYVGTGGFAYAGVFPLTFTSTDYVAGGNIWKRIAWSGDTW